MAVANEASMNTHFYCHTRRAKREGNLTWKIEGLMHADMFQTEIRISSSPTFSIPGCEREFTVQLETSTETNYKEGYVGLFLCYSKGLENCTVSYEFSFVDVTQQKSCTKRFRNIYRNSDGRWGRENFITRKELQDKEPALINNEEVTVSCVVTVWENPKVSSLYSQPLLGAHCDRSSMTDDWKVFYDQKLSTDVLIKVGKQQMPAHKAVLMCRSPVFAAMFGHDMLEKISSEVIVEDIDSDVFEELLRYMYTDDFQRRGVRFVAKLMVAGDKYDIQSLKGHCSDYLCDNLTTGNVLEVLKITEFCSTEDLDKRCLLVVDNELFKANSMVDCMKKMEDLPMVLCLLKKRVVDECGETEQNKRHCPENREFRPNSS